ncbi:NADH pyrophosphatase [Arthrobacter sp. RIT-PI-e]|uniref:NAD(+) diphosphatase n=1 Tax=Arthrobacter sp. RIT-PI-e TaxID=1681197 RepID=UPI000675D7FD|nr:NAD(+) diphosphatase [Arthrobacter sp. RIT-PI-e]KNC20072.1 NADH pyrophosphatase [Arthrobacter sp. RIT-PI-e]
MTDPLRTLVLPALGSLPLSRAGSDRDGYARTTGNLLDTLWAAPETRVLPIAGGKAPVRGSDLVLLSPERVTRPELVLYLGRIDEGMEDAGRQVVAAVLPEIDTGLAPAEQWMGLRDIAASLDGRDTGLFVEAAGLANWHATHTHCSRCGAPTEAEDAGWVRRCTKDGSSHHPRTDPAIIVSVVDDDDRLLLGSAAAWPDDRFSTLAGYVEPGESLEAAVIREVGEESAVEVRSPEYLGSQPWPFPASLMLGFTARAVTTDAVADGVEMRSVRWFTRQELFTEVRDGTIAVAGGVSIARALIERWYGGPLDGEPSEARP